MKKIWIDNLRVLAIIAVIIIHVSAGYLFDFSPECRTHWWIGLFFLGTMKFCVPVFVMISGALLLRKQYTLQEYLKKRFVRVLIPFIFWSLIYIFRDIAISISRGEPALSLNFLKYIINGLVFGVSSSSHLWYIYMILGIYLFVPIIQKWTAHNNIIEIKFYLIIWLLTLTINWFISSTPTENGYNFTRGINLIYFSGFLGYFILGYFLSNNDFLDKKKRLTLSLSFIVIGLIITYWGTYAVSKLNNEYSRNFIRYLTPNVFLVAAGIFILFKDCCNNYIKTPLLSKMRQLISKHSYGIYLSHIFVMYLLDYLNINKNFIHPVIGILLTTFLCLFGSLATTLIINKLPYGKYVSG